MRSARSGLGYTLAVIRGLGISQGKRVPIALDSALKPNLNRTYTDCQGKRTPESSQGSTQPKIYQNVLERDKRVIEGSSPVMMNTTRNYADYKIGFTDEGKRAPDGSQPKTYDLIQGKRFPNATSPKVQQKRKYSVYELELQQERRSPNSAGLDNTKNGLLQERTLSFHISPRNQKRKYGTDDRCLEINPGHKSNNCEELLNTGKRSQNIFTTLNQKRNYADCEKKGKKKTMTVCQAPPNEPKVIPPYEYGFCRDRDPDPPVGCPKKKESKKKGPCCKSSKPKGGCKG